MTSPKAASTDVLLRSAAKFRSLSLQDIGIETDWGSFMRSPDGEIQHGDEHILKVLDLSFNRLRRNDLFAIFRSLPPSVSELAMKSCSITFRSVPLLCDQLAPSELTGRNQIKKLDLSSNPVGTRGAAAILTAISNNNTPLEYVALSHEKINLNKCLEPLRKVLVGSGLVSLDLMLCKQLELDCIRVLAAGLRENETLKAIKLPLLDLKHIDVLGESLIVNRSLESFFVFKELDFDEEGDLILEELEAEEEASVLSFIKSTWPANIRRESRPCSQC